MKSRINPFLLAHGATTGPSMFPMTSGLISGILAMLAGIVLLTLLGGQKVLELEFGFTAVHVDEILFGALAGVSYGKIYRRVALDLKGGWMFGMSFGFLLWIVVFAGLGSWFYGRPLLNGRAAVAVFLAHLFFGFLLGISFPFVHFLLAHKILAKQR